MGYVNPKSREARQMVESIKPKPKSNVVYGDVAQSDDTEAPVIVGPDVFIGHLGSIQRPKKEPPEATVPLPSVEGKEDDTEKR